jgi:hypothetical protein
MPKEKKIFKNGFTFIETILYIALATVIGGILFSYGWNMVSARVKSATVRNTYSGARLVEERLKRELREAIDVDKNNSVFDQAPGKIIFTTSDGEVRIESAGDKISIKRENNSPEYLHSDNVRIKNFILTKQISSDDKIEYVGFSFDAQADYPNSRGRYEYQYSFPLRGGVEIRSR